MTEKTLEKHARTLQAYESAHRITGVTYIREEGYYTKWKKLLQKLAKYKIDCGATDPNWEQIMNWKFENKTVQSMSLPGQLIHINSFVSRAFAAWR